MKEEAAKHHEEEISHHEDAITELQVLEGNLARYM